MVSTPSAGFKASAGALNAPNQASMNAGQAIGQAGQMLGDFAQKLQGAVNYGIAADADRKMRQTAADFQQSRVGRTDEDQWETEWKERSDEVYSSLSDQHNIGPSLKRQLTQNFKDWQQANAIEVRTMANKQKINRATERVGLAADEAARDGDERGIHTAFDGAVDNHLMTPEVASKLKIGYLNKIDEYAARTFIVNNPASAVPWLEQKGEGGKPANVPRLNPDQRAILLNSARVQRDKYWDDNLQSLKNGVDEGNVLTEEQLDERQSLGVISQRQVQGYRAYVKQRSGQTNIEDLPMHSAEVMTAVNAIPANLSADERMAYVVAIKASKAYNSLTDPLRADFNSALKAEVAPDRPAVAERKRLDDDDREKNGVFLPMGVVKGARNWLVPNDPDTSAPLNPSALKGKGLQAIRAMTDDDIATTFGKDFKMRDVLRQEELRWGKYLTAMRGYEKENPKATDEELAIESQRLKRPYIMQSVSEAIAAPTASPAIDQIPTFTPAQAKSAKPGTKYKTTDGRVLVR